MTAAELLDIADRYPARLAVATTYARACHLPGGPWTPEQRREVLIHMAGDLTLQQWGEIMGVGAGTIAADLREIRRMLTDCDDAGSARADSVGVEDR